MKRQGLNVSINELEILKNDLINQDKKLKDSLGYKYIDYNKRWMISIINKKPECSDTWEIEDAK